MTTLPTFAECAAVPPEKRTALQTFIYMWPNSNSDEFRGYLTAVIEEERKERDAVVDRFLDYHVQDEREIHALAARIAEQDAQIESLQNKWATRPLDPHDKKRDALAAQLKEVMEQLNEAMTNEGSKDCRIDDLEKALQKFGSHTRSCKAWGRPRPDLCTCGYVAAFGGVNAFNQVAEDALAKEPTT